MTHTKKRGFIGAALVLTASLVLSACGGAGGSKYPTSPIEVVVPYAAGGGSDVLARNIQASIDRQKLVSQPMNIVNKPGGGGAVGISYTAAKKGDTHTLVTFIDAAVSQPLIPANSKQPTYKDLTIIGLLALDEFLVCVPANSPHKTIKDLVAFGKANPGALKLATASANGEDHVFGATIEKATGAKFTYVHTKGGSEAMKNLVGGHVDIAVPNAGETLSQVEGKLVRCLAVASDKRMETVPLLKDVPTLKENGIDVKFQMFRGIAAPAGIPDNVLKYWQGVLEKVHKDPEWQKTYIQKFGLTPFYATGKDAQAHIEKTIAQYTQAFKDIGVIK